MTTDFTTGLDNLLPLLPQKVFGIITSDIGELLSISARLRMKIAAPMRRATSR